MLILVVLCWGSRVLIGSDQSLSRVQFFATLWTAAHQASLSITKSRTCSDSCPLSQWCHPTISSSLVPFPSCPQSFPASGSFPVSQSFASGGQSVVASASVLPMNIQDWFRLGLTSLISLQSKELSRVFSNTTVQKHHFFGTQLSLWSNSHIHIKWKWKSLSRVWLFATPLTIQSTEFPGQNTGMGSLSFSRGSSQPSGQTQVSHIAGGFLTSWATYDYWKNHSFDYTGLCRQSNVSAFLYAV